MKTLENESDNKILNNNHIIMSKSTPLAAQKFYPNHNHHIFTTISENTPPLNVNNNSNRTCKHPPHHYLVKSPSSPANINLPHSILLSNININDNNNDIIPSNPTPFRKRSNSYTKETNVVFKSRDNDGFKMVNEYVFVRKLGSGTYGKVHLAYHNLTHQLFAIKVFNKIRLKKKSYGFGRGNAFQDVLTEIAVMKKLNHQNVVKLYEVINDPKDEESLYIVMEYIEGGSIMPHLNYNHNINNKNNMYNSNNSNSNNNSNNINNNNNNKKNSSMSENLARKYFRDIVLGLEYLHEQKVIHRDIKPENLLVNKDGHVKIADFGVSHMFDMESGDVLNSSKGSPAFIAPELCNFEDGRLPISGKAVDIWALGISLYCLIFGKVPFTSCGGSGGSGDSSNEEADSTSTTLQTIYDRIQFQTIIYSNEISQELLNLFKRLLDRNPSTRITISEIKSHPWTTINGLLPMKEFNDLEEEQEQDDEIQCKKDNLFKEDAIHENMDEDSSLIINNTSSTSSFDTSSSISSVSGSSNSILPTFDNFQYSLIKNDILNNNNQIIK